MERIKNSVSSQSLSKSEPESKLPLKMENCRISSCRIIESSRSLSVSNTISSLLLKLLLHHLLPKERKERTRDVWKLVATTNDKDSVAVTKALFDALFYL